MKKTSYVLKKLSDYFQNSKMLAGAILLISVTYVYNKFLFLIIKLRCHPLPAPWLGISEGQNKLSVGQGRSSARKLDAILGLLPAGTSTIVDIGANNCFFSISLAKQGVHSFCYEPDIEFLRIAFASIDQGVKHISISSMAIDRETVKLVPQVDVMLLLSVAQRWLHTGGADEMKLILAELLMKTNKVIFFELPNMVESKKEAKYLQFLGTTVADFDENIKQLFLSIGASQVQKIGQYESDHNNDLKRDLFAIYR